LGIGIAVLAATPAIRSPEGYAATGPRFAPLLVGSLLVVLSALYLARTLVRPDAALAEHAARERERTHWPAPALVLAGLLAYVSLLEPLGYVVATTLFVPGVARVLGSRRTVRDLAVGLGLGVTIFVAFTQFLGVALPAGLTPIT